MQEKISLLRAAAYGFGGFLFVSAAMAAGFVIAITGPPNVAEVKEVAAILSEGPPAESRADEATVGPRFPSFAPQGVIVVTAPSRGESPVKEAEVIRVNAAQRNNAQRQVSRESLSEAARVHRPQDRRSAAPSASIASARSPEPPSRPATSEAAAEARVTQINAEERRDETGPLTDEAQSDDDARDTRSWYGSPEYHRELAQRRAGRGGTRSR